jgi:peptidoglycan hydrolase-like protein with peptidoglycan-binding domain
VPLDNTNKEDVKSIQEALNLITNSKLVTDGSYGPSTTKAVSQWQNKCRLMKLPVNDAAGIFGDSTKWWTCIALAKIRDGEA